MRRIFPAVLAATGAVVPVGMTAWAATHPTTPTPTPTSAIHARATATAHARATATAHARATATAHARATAVVATAKPVTIQGPSVNMDWGPVQVTIIVKGKKVVDVQATAPMERARSNFINSQAIPWLRQETLQAQSANIDLIGGATLTSEAYTQSLQAALDQAHL